MAVLLFWENSSPGRNPSLTTPCRKLPASINDIGYAGWMQIEGGLPPKADLVASYAANLKFLRGLFLA